MRGKHAEPPKGYGKAAMVAATVVSSGAIPIITAAEAHAATASDWDSVAQCEAGGDWSINYSGDGMSVGGLQFQTASWNAALDYLASQGYDVSGWNRNLYQGMPRSEVPSKDQTILAGEALLHLQGASAWTTVTSGCAHLGTSMFDGGPNPWGLPGTQAPSGMGGAVTTAATANAVPSGVSDTSGNSDGSISKHGRHGRRAKHAVSANVPLGDSDDTYVPKHAASGGHYTVRPGDWLIKIGNRVGESWHALYRENRSVVGADPNLIFPGQVLTLDPGAQ